MEKRKTVIVTGASRGIGRTIAILFASKGYRVLMNYHQSAIAVYQTCEKLKKEGKAIYPYKADVTKRKQTDSMVERCLKLYGSVDILINNAGITQQKLFTEITEREWDKIVDTNLKGSFNCAQSVLKYMIAQKEGKIINISSIWGMVGASCEVHYSAAKAGVIGMTKALAKELAPSNIQVNCIAPGIVQTDMLAFFTANELDELKNQTPLQRIGSTKDVAACAYFLASEDADFITGQVISPNGGYVM
ncbi:3-oxoacyl-ACP reductase FabG [Dehalobacter sp. DCM]|uniref:elongation factor P 5-aminopentanone reductase n=1 Tax=Dehalobacter sp. DCM TaxID=2907827 RepID=UPI003081988F|nr:3-oxoacyl-ACP reductase FabG [Dehalobacter sp. DCM]